MYFNMLLGFGELKFAQIAFKDSSAGIWENDIPNWIVLQQDCIPDFVCNTKISINELSTHINEWVIAL